MTRPSRLNVWPLAPAVTGLLLLTTPAARADEFPEPGPPGAPLVDVTTVEMPTAPTDESLSGAEAQSTGEERLRLLEETVRKLQEEIRQLRAEKAKPDAKEVEKAVDETLAKRKPLVGFGSDGFSFESADKKHRLRLRGLLQADARVFGSDSSRTGVDSLFLRRARPIFEGTLHERFDFRIMPDFGLGSTSLVDAYIDARFTPAAILRAGKFKEPLSLERLQGGADGVFVERSLANILAPNRDVGFELRGDVLDRRLTYQIAAFNGTNDGGSLDGDTADGKDFVGRLFAHPFRNSPRHPLNGLGVGIAGSVGERGDSESLSSVNFRTAGRSTFFRYRSDVVEEGTHWRIAPQLYYYRGPFGFMAEHITSHTSASRGGVEQDVRNRAWFAQASWLITGEKAGFRNPSPRKPFDPSKNQWGAFEVAFRYSDLRLDDSIYEANFADAALYPSRARAYTFGLNWYLNNALKLQFTWERTDFNRSVTFGSRSLDREDAFFTRLQVAF